MTNQGIHSIGGAITLGTFGGEVIAVITDLRWMIIFCVALILADFWWGWRESSLRKEQAPTRRQKEKHKFHFSLAGRRTLNKTVDYMSYLLIGALAGLAITEPMGLCGHTTTAATGLGFGCLFEISSIIGHVCFVKGWNIQINYKRLIVALLKFKWKELAEVIDEGIEEIDDKKGGHHKKRKKHNDDDIHHCGDDINEEEISLM